MSSLPQRAMASASEIGSWLDPAPTHPEIRTAQCGGSVEIDLSVLPFSVRGSRVALVAAPETKVDSYDMLFFIGKTS